MSDWQPIETAPKDGTTVLIYARDERGVYAAYWGDICHGYGRRHKAVGGWCAPYSDQDEQGGVYSFEDVTHWMPLPEPPK